MDMGRVVDFLARGRPSDAEARLRFDFYSVFVAVGLPNFLAFGTLAFIQRNDLLGALILASAVALLVGWYRLRRGHDDRAVYRFNAMLFGLLVIELLAIGGESGSKSLWVYVYPLVVVFLFGVREGTLWAAGLFVCAGAVLTMAPGWLGTHPYAPAFTLRLMTMYVVLTVITAGFEHSRRVYRDRMLVEHDKLEIESQLLRQEIAERQKAEREKAALILELQDTLAQVKTLKGLVPICANCHKIRDDQGFWNQLETYLRAHSDAQFSHGICPDCMASLYPGHDDAG